MRSQKKRIILLEKLLKGCINDQKGNQLIFCNCYGSIVTNESKPKVNRRGEKGSILNMLQYIRKGAIQDMFAYMFKHTQTAHMHYYERQTLPLARSS